MIAVPVDIALTTASIVAILSLPFLNIEFMVQGMITGLDSFPLLAVIRFTLAGNLMSQGGYLGVFSTSQSSFLDT